MSATRTVFLIGPGYIGWNVLDLLVAEGYTVTALVRRGEHAEQIRDSGAEAVVGDLHDRRLITKHTCLNDIIIHTALADDLPSVEAVVDGIRQRARHGQSTVFIHTSGACVLDDKSMGSRRGTRIYHDNIEWETISLAHDGPEREVDLAIFHLQQEHRNTVKCAMITPLLVYGFNPKHKRLSIHIPTLTRFALKYGFAGYIGHGLAVQSNVHVMDLARGYVCLLHHLETTPATLTGKDLYWYCEATGSDEPPWKDVASLIAEQLHEAGRCVNPLPRTIHKRFYKNLFGKHTGAVLGLNSRSRAMRLRELGWAPIEKDWCSSYIDEELPELLKEDPEDFHGYVGTVSS